MYTLPSSQRLEVVAYIPTVNRLLDVGCNEGDFGLVVADRGTEVWGIEPKVSAAAIAATRLNKVITGLYPEDFPEGETFDCVVFNDVLEHMPDPGPALQAARRQLRPGGFLIASMPNVRHISVVSDLVRRGRWDYQDWGLMDRTHLRFFTKSTMRELVEAAGFLVEQQIPNFWIKPTGKRRLLKLLGRHGEEFLAMQYLLIARPA